MQNVIRNRRRFPVWAAVLFYGATLLIGQLVTGNPKQNRGLYEKKLEQAPWAPPGWVFGPAWALINIFITRALFMLLNDPEKDRRDRALLALQVGIWLIFVTFGIAYFRKRSPVLAAVWTIADAALALASVLIARKRGWKLAVNYLPLLAWTSFASTVAVYQAVENDDPVFG
jgi:tryptophan-rich sensory protein